MDTYLHFLWRTFSYLLTRKISQHVPCLPSIVASTNTRENHLRHIYSVRRIWKWWVLSHLVPLFDHASFHNYPLAILAQHNMNISRKVMEISPSLTLVNIIPLANDDFIYKLSLASGAQDSHLRLSNLRIPRTTPRLPRGRVFPRTLLTVEIKSSFPYQRSAITMDVIPIQIIL